MSSWETTYYWNKQPEYLIILQYGITVIIKKGNKIILFLWLSGLVVNMLEYDIGVSKSESQSRYQTSLKS